MSKKQQSSDQSQGLLQIPTQYRHTSTVGNRLPGWEELKVEVLAEELGVTAGHLRAVLVGRRGVSVKLTLAIAGLIGVRATRLSELIDNARRADERRRREARDERELREWQRRDGQQTRRNAIR